MSRKKKEEPFKIILKDSGLDPEQAKIRIAKAFDILFEEVYKSRSVSKARPRGAK